MRRVVITGMGMITPLGIGVKESWERLLKGESGIDRITKFDPSGHRCQIAAEVKEFSPEPMLTKKDLKMMDPFIQYAIIAASEAIEDAGLDLEKEDPLRMGVSIGVGIGGAATWEENVLKLKEKGPSRVDLRAVPKMIPNLASGRSAIRWKLKGVNLSPSMACAAGAQAIGEAFEKIQIGKAVIMIAGGTEAVITSTVVAAFENLRAVSTTRNQEPKKASRPFDKDRDGFVLGEGAGILILEELSHALQREAKIYAEIKGYGLCSDAWHVVDPDPEGEGALNCMKLALAEAEIEPAQLDLINAHGTATPKGDVAEAKAIKALLGEENLPKVLVTSSKAAIGHLIGAAGAVEAIFSILSIRDKMVPPQLNYENPDENCSFLNIPTTLQKRDIKIVLSNSFGFGGTNVTLVFKEFEI